MSRKSLENALMKLASGDELGRITAMIRTRDDTRAEADHLFGANAADMRKQDRDMIQKLFVQGPYAYTMAPNLQKEASSETSSESKTDSAVENFFEKKALNGPIVEIGGFGTPSAIGYVIGKSSIPQSRSEAEEILSGGYSIPAGLMVPGYTGYRHGRKSSAKNYLRAKDEEAAGRVHHEPKTASAVVEFFEKKAYLTEAQKRYPELLKVGEQMVPAKVPNITSASMNRAGAKTTGSIGSKNIGLSSGQ